MAEKVTKPSEVTDLEEVPGLICMPLRRHFQDQLKWLFELRMMVLSMVFSIENWKIHEDHCLRNTTSGFRFG